ncbi:MAG: hypothetical protein JXR51_01880 [Bacteroidales bacterium]|nr:hypothetical protein [Bacteroidales bacterium]
MKIKNILISVSFILFLINTLAVAQDENNEPKKVILKLQYLKLNDGTKVLSSKLYYKENKNFMPVIDQNVTFTAESDSSELILGTIKSDKEGYAILHIVNDFKFPLNENGFTIFTAKLKKSEKFKSAKKSVEIKDAELNFLLNIVDSLKMVDVKITTLNNEGETIPVENTDVYVYVKRLYSLFTVEKGSTDENGQLQVKFPMDMPGDSTGNLTVIVKLLDNDEYGTIEKSQNIQWGTVVSYSDDQHLRALWASAGEAPLWMLIAVAIILLGAWFNFGLAIYKVSKIKKVA